MRSKMYLIFMIALLTGSGVGMIASVNAGEEPEKTDDAFL